MVKSIIDMSRPNMMYAAGLGFIMLVSLVLSNIPGFSFTHYLDFPHRKQVCAGLFLAGAILGAAAVQRLLTRAKFPWKIQQSQVAIPYAGFFMLTLLAILIAR